MQLPHCGVCSNRRSRRCLGSHMAHLPISWMSPLRPLGDRFSPTAVVGIGMLGSTLCLLIITVGSTMPLVAASASASLLWYTVNPTCPHGTWVSLPCAPPSLTSANRPFARSLLSLPTPVCGVRHDVRALGSRARSSSTASSKPPAGPSIRPSWATGCPGRAAASSSASGLATSALGTRTGEDHEVVETAPNIP